MRENWEYSEFRRCFNWKTNETRGRTLLLLNNFLVSIGNVFITRFHGLHRERTASNISARSASIALFPYIRVRSRCLIDDSQHCKDKRKMLLFLTTNRVLLHLRRSSDDE